MAGIPKVKITFDADFDDLKKGIKGGQDEIQGFAGRVEDFGKKAAAAFAVAAAAAAAYAVKLAVDGVKAAIEDEAAQVRLATALKNATGATDSMIKSVEQQILKQSLATGVADEKLRPALSRLALSTNDVTKAQDLLTLALDISQATGKGLDSVANALGKAYDGNTAALGKLGIGLSSAELKTMSFTDVQTKLSDLFGGSAAANAETFAGRLQILKVTFDEAKESVGAKLLPIIQKLVEFVVNEVVPALGKFADFFKPITDAISANKEEFATFIAFIQKYVVPVLVNVLGGAFKVVGEIAGGVINVIGAVVGGLNTLIAGAVAGINSLIRVYNSIPFLPNVGLISAPSINVPTVSVPSVGAISAVPKVVVPSVSGGSGSGSSGGGSGGGLVAAMSGAAMSSGTTYSTALTQSAAIRRAELASGSTINVTVNGAIDSEGTARTIVNTLNDSYYRGTGGGGQLITAPQGFF
jgi:hypothetical protein